MEWNAGENSRLKSIHPEEDLLVHFGSITAREGGQGVGSHLNAVDITPTETLDQVAHKRFRNANVGNTIVPAHHTIGRHPAPRMDFIIDG